MENDFDPRKKSGGTVRVTTFLVRIDTDLNSAHR
jgi:hypothetical protein